MGLKKGEQLSHIEQIRLGRICFRFFRQVKEKKNPRYMDLGVPDLPEEHRPKG